MALSETVFKAVCSALVKAAVALGGKKLQAWTLQSKIENKLRDVALQTFENIEPLLTAEGVKADKQDFLITSCLAHIKPLLKKPEQFYSASLSGEKLRNQLFGKAGAPQEIIDENLTYPFQLIFPRVADLFCAYLPLVAELRDKEVREIFVRFDEVQKKLTAISEQLTAIDDRPLKGAEQHFHQLHKLTRSEVVGTLSLTGLHGVGEYEISLDDIFVLPAIVPPEKSKLKPITDEPATLAELCAPGARSFIEGQPGAGKTTWTGWLQRLVLAQISTRLAVRLRLREYAQDDLPSYYDLVRQRVDKHLAARIKDEQIDKWIEAGRVVFILDGFDEVTPARREEIRNWMTGLSDNAQQSAILVTSRPLSTDHLTTLPKRWSRWSIAAFDAPRIEDYIRRWYARCPFVKEERRKVDAAALAEQWSGDRTLADLTGNPLMLGTLLAVHNRESQQLPRGRAKLYEKYIEGMLDLWEKRIAVQRDLEFPYAAKRKLLQHFALWFLQNNTLTVGEEEPGGGKGMHDLVRELLPELKLKPPAGAAKDFAPAVLAELRERTGMLEGPGTYAFVHKSVAEYLFAFAVNEGHLRTIEGETLDRHWLFHRRMEDRWLGVLYFWAGMTTVQNLQSFIVDSGSDANPDARLLELALLYDQLDRLPKEFLCNQVERLVVTEMPYRGSTCVSNPYGFPKSHATQFRFYQWGLPALRNLRSYSAFIELLPVTGVPNMDLNRLHPAWAGHVLFALQRSICDTSSMSQAIGLAELACEYEDGKTEPPFSRIGPNAAALETMIAVIDSGFRNEIPKLNNELLGELLSTFPMLLPLLPFAVLGLLARQGHESKSAINAIPRTVVGIDSALLLTRSAPMNRHILRQTHFCWEWFIGQNYDLLELCQRALNRLAKEPNTAPPDAVRRVREYVESLLTERERLWSLHGKPTQKEVNEGTVPDLPPEAT